MIFLVMFYIMFHSPSGDYVRSYDGLSQAQVESLANSDGVSWEYISSDTYTSFMQARQNTGL